MYSNHTISQETPLNSLPFPTLCFLDLTSLCSELSSATKLKKKSFFTINLREQDSPPALTRKRHTDRGITSPRYAVLVGGGGVPGQVHPGGGGYLARSSRGGGYLGRGEGGYLGRGGTLAGGVPWPGGGGYLVRGGRYPPLPPRCGLTDKLKTLPSLVLRTRSVKMNTTLRITISLTTVYAPDLESRVYSINLPVLEINENESRRRFFYKIHCKNELYLIINSFDLLSL